MGDTDIYRMQGFGQKLGLGKSVALIVVDFTNGFADPAMLGGGNIPDAIRNTKTLLKSARDRNWPIVYTRHVYAADGSDHNLFNVKLPTNNLLIEGSFAAEIVSDLAPQAGEFIINKQFPSAFIGTNLAAWLMQRRVDTLIISGCTTSGCVRATTVDAMCAGLRPIVARDCVGDRAEGPHQANLFDLQQKYADVLSSNEILASAEIQSDAL